MRYLVIIFAIVGLLTFILGVLLLVFHVKIVKKKVFDEQVLREASPDSVKRWRENPLDSLFINTFIYNHSKQDYKEQDKVAQVGPFTYSIKISKDNVLFDETDHVSYKEVTQVIETNLEKEWKSRGKVGSFVPVKESGETKLTQVTPYETIFASEPGMFPGSIRRHKITINTGNSDPHLLGIIESIDSEKTTKSGQPIRGTDGYQFPGVTPDSSIEYFDTILNLVIRLEFQEVTETNDTKVFKFVVSPKQVEEAQTDGLSNFKISLHRNQDVLHYFLVEPISGRVLSFRREYMAWMKVNNILVPVARYSMTLQASEKTLKFIEDTVSYRLKVMQSVGGYVLTASVVTILLTIFTMKRLTKKTGIMEFVMHPLKSSEGDEDKQILTE